MVANLRASFEDILNGSDWLDKESKQLAIKKLHGINLLIGASENAFDDVSLDRDHADWNITEGMDYTDMINATNYFVQRHLWREYFEKKKTGIFGGYTAEVNAAYSLTKNGIRELF